MRQIFRSVAAIAALLVSGVASHARADILADGTFAASKTCPAFLSFRKSTNPGDINVQAGRSYPVISQNASPPSHYRLRVDAANPPERWVSIDCGTFAAAGSAASAPASPTTTAAASAATGAMGKPAEYILSLSWEPAFCENHQSKPECAAETAAGFAASHLSLHGLWPQPISKQYCNVDASLLDADKHGSWPALPAVDLSPDMKTRLDAAMPGTQSSLERHEWLRHGTCYNGADADTYFGEALALVDAVNGSPVQALLAANIGKQVTADQVRHAFDQAFGAGAGERVRLACEQQGSRRLLSEITIGLVGRVGIGKTPADLIMASSPTSPGCPAGEVDAVAK
ncbi:MAG TPA: ribonuclease [Bauldia sp.]